MTTNNAADNTRRIQRDALLDALFTGKSYTVVREIQRAPHEEKLTTIVGAVGRHVFEVQRIGFPVTSEFRFYVGLTTLQEANNRGAIDRMPASTNKSGRSRATKADLLIEQLRKAEAALAEMQAKAEASYTVESTPEATVESTPEATVESTPEAVESASEPITGEVDNTPVRKGRRANREAFASE